MASRASAVLLALSFSAAVHAQQGAAHRPLTPPPARPPMLQPPPIVMPLPPLTPQPAGGLTTPVPFAPPDLNNPSRDLYRVPADRPFRSRGLRPGTGLVIGAPYFDIAEPEPTSPRQAAPTITEFGILRLNVTPGSAQVFVDDYYVGTVADVDARRGLMLGAGPHRITIRASGYETVTFDVRIDPSEPITYRAALEPSKAAPPRQPASAGATRLYVIPNCYLGNIPPRADRLPRGCDVKQVRVVGDR